MNVLHYPIPHAPDVLPHPLLRFFRVFLPQGIDDSPVLIQGGFHSIRHAPGRESKNTDMVMKAGNKLDEPAGIRKQDNALVKFEVLPGIALYVLFVERLLEPLNAGLQLGQAGIGHSFRGQTCRQPLQVLADEEEFEDVLFGGLNDKGAPLGENFHQALFLQPIDGFPHRRAADAKGFSQIPLFQLLSRRNPAFQDDPF